MYIVHRPNVFFVNILARTILSLMMLCEAHALAQSKELGHFALHDGDRVVFYGDSITAQRFYTVYVAEAVHAFYPEWNIEFYNAGSGGDSVRGGVLGSIDERLRRDVFRFKPTGVVVMLGMNDRSHAAEYQAGYEHILQSIRASDPSIRITVLSPTPVDGVTSHDPASNVELDKFTEIDRRLALKYGALFVDLHHKVLDALTRAEKTNDLAAAALIPDRIHPQPPIHFLMAETVLRSWKFSEEAAELALDGKAGRVDTAFGVTVTELVRTRDGLSWVEIDAPDQLRFTSRDGNEILYRQLLGSQHIGTRILRVEGLDADQHYQLFIDQKPIDDSVSGLDLRRGIHLELADTPMHRAGVDLYYACSEAELEQTNRSHLLGTKGLSVELRTQTEMVFDQAIGRALARVKRLSVRSKHTFSLQVVP